jgi:putative SOS response-associated peptidase YedK
MQAIHDRMPLILPQPHQAAWLDAATPDIEAWLAALAPYPGSEMQAYPVSRRVNSPQYNDVECIRPLAE